MAKFMGNGMLFTIGGNSITCLQSVSTTENIDNAIVKCAGGTDGEYVTGIRDSQMTVNLALETDDVTVLGYFDPGDSGAIVFQPNGATAGDIKITSTSGAVLSRNINTTVNGFTTASFTLGLDDLSIAANT